MRTAFRGKGVGTFGVDGVVLKYVLCALVGLGGVLMCVLGALGGVGGVRVALGVFGM